MKTDEQVTSPSISLDKVRTFRIECDEKRALLQESLEDIQLTLAKLDKEFQDLCATERVLEKLRPDVRSAYRFSSSVVCPKTRPIKKPPQKGL